jgi:triacylglycerol lipase
MPLNAQAKVSDNAKILGQAAAIAYETPGVCERWAVAQGFTPGTFDFIEGRDTQGFIVQDEHTILVAFRGTQPNRPVDWLSDAKARHARWAHNIGKVHTGFYEALDVVWRAGHSLGGALAELCAARACFDPRITSIPIEAVYTFGQPRVGDSEFATLLHDKMGVSVHRFVNDRDIVPRVPLFGMGYCHFGNMTFFDHAGTPGDPASAIETLKTAVVFAERALSAEPIKQLAGVAGDLLTIANPLLSQERRDEIIRARWNAILQSGIENVTDHDMRECYLARLGAKL